MQHMQQMVPPYSMDLYNTASAAGYWAERLSADEQQRSYLVMQQVPIPYVQSWAHASPNFVWPRHNNLPTGVLSSNKLCWPPVV